MVGVNVDDEVAKQKGPDRPVYPLAQRLEILAEFRCIDYLVAFPEPTAHELISAVMPDVYVKGSDYENPEDDVTGMIVRERDAVEKHGGRVVFTKDITFSSSELINKYLGVYDAPLQDYLDKLRGTGSAPDSRALGKWKNASGEHACAVSRITSRHNRRASHVPPAPAQ